MQTDSASPIETVLVAGTIGDAAGNPLFVSQTKPPALKFFSSSGSQQQVATGAGVLWAVSNYEQQIWDAWDHVGGGPTDSDLIVHVKELSPAFHIFDVPFTDGLRVDGEGKDYVVHYFMT